MDLWQPCDLRTQNMTKSYQQPADQAYTPLLTDTLGRLKVESFNPVIYIFLNQELHMSVGKAAAQAAHAVAMSFVKLNKPTDVARWDDSPHRTIIVLKARDEAHMRNIKDYLAERDIRSRMIIDEGVNEIDPHTPTALATPILNKDDEYVIKTIGAKSNFKFYKDFVTVKTEFER
jgi:peptidyl-tRNA hydrolase